MSKHTPLWLTATFGPPYDIQQDSAAPRPTFRHRKTVTPGSAEAENQEWTDGLPPKEAEEAETA